MLRENLAPSRQPCASRPPTGRAVDAGLSGALSAQFLGRAARDLLMLFPDVHDGYDRLGMVYEARGENRQAADCCRKVIAFIREHADTFEPAFEASFVKLVNRLAPPAAT